MPDDVPARLCSHEVTLQDGPLRLRPPGGIGGKLYLPHGIGLEPLFLYSHFFLPLG